MGVHTTGRGSVIRLKFSLWGRSKGEISLGRGRAWVGGDEKRDMGEDPGRRYLLKKRGPSG